MNRSLLSGLIIGLCVGAGITSAFFLTCRRCTSVSQSAAPVTAPVKTAVPVPEETPAPAAKVEVPTPAPAKVESAAPATPGTFDFKTSFAALAKKGLAGYGSKEMRELADNVKAAGKPGLQQVIQQVQTSTSAQERFIAIALLESIGDPAALPVLDNTLKTDPDLLARRMASHAAALIGTDAAAEILRPAMLKDEDWGVRVNSAYGLAKLKQQDGLEALQQYYSSTDTPAEYRLAILGGLADVAAPSTGPLFRQILNDTTDPGYLLIAIGALDKMKDKQSLADLQRIASSAKSDMIRQAAQRAIDNLNK